MIESTWLAAAETERGKGVMGGGAEEPIIDAGATLGSASLVRAATAPSDNFDQTGNNWEIISLKYTRQISKWNLHHLPLQLLLTPLPPPLMLRPTLLLMRVYGDVYGDGIVMVC